MTDIAALVARARRDVDDGPLPSCQLAVARAGELLCFETIGDAPAGNDSRYVTYSCSKAIFASVVWAAVSDGLLRFDTRVADVIPEFATNGKEVVTINHLLTMTAGFPRAPLGPPDWLTSDGRTAAFVRWRLDWEPGSRCEYHETSAHWVLAEVVERVSGVDFRAFFGTRIAEPLGLSLVLGASPLDDTLFAEPVAVGEPPTAEELEAVTGIAGIQLPNIPDEHLNRFRDPAIRAAGQPAAGVIGTAADVARYYQALLANDGSLLDPDVVRDVTSVVRTGDLVDPIRACPALRTRGAMVAGDDGHASRRGFGRRTSPRAFGHDGAGGQVAWADPDTGLSFCYLTNGIDAHLLRMSRRGVALSDLVCARA